MLFWCLIRINGPLNKYLRRRKKFENRWSSAWSRFTKSEDLHVHFILWYSAWWRMRTLLSTFVNLQTCSLPSNTNNIEFSKNWGILTYYNFLYIFFNCPLDIQFHVFLTFWRVLWTTWWKVTMLTSYSLILRSLKQKIILHLDQKPRISIRATDHNLGIQPRVVAYDL